MPIIEKCVEKQSLALLRKEEGGPLLFWVPKKRMLFRGEEAQRSVELFEQSEKTISGASC